MYLMLILEPNFDSCKKSFMYGLLRSFISDKLLLHDDLFQ
jgi:hypothetical protein